MERSAFEHGLLQQSCDGGDADNGTVDDAELQLLLPVMVIMLLLLLMMMAMAMMTMMVMVVGSG